MKNTIFPLLLLLLLGSIEPLFAQETSSLKSVVGGQFNFVTIKGADYGFGQVQLYGQQEARTRIFDLQPYWAFKIGKSSLLGLRMGYGNSYSAQPNFNGNSFTLKNFANTLSGGVFTRHYLRPAAKFSFFFEPSVSLSRTKYKQQQNNSGFFGQYKYRQFTAQVAPGVAYHITQRLGLLMRFGQVAYVTGKNIFDDDSGRPFHDFRVNFSLTSLSWGLEFRLGEGE